jgi:hypothetical protein
MSIYWGVMMAFMNSNYRLLGLVDNGLVWKRRNTRLRKYDFTSDFEKYTFWRYLRIRD